MGDRANQRARILQYLDTVSPGATRNEIRIGTHIMYQTICRRLVELENNRQVKRNGHRACSITKARNIEYGLTKKGAEMVVALKKAAAARAKDKNDQQDQ